MGVRLACSGGGHRRWARMRTRLHRTSPVIAVVLALFLVGLGAGTATGSATAHAERHGLIRLGVGDARTVGVSGSCIARRSKRARASARRRRGAARVAPPPAATPSRSTGGRRSDPADRQPGALGHGRRLQVRRNRPARASRWFSSSSPSRTAADRPARFYELSHGAAGKHPRPRLDSGPELELAVDSVEPRRARLPALRRDRRALRLLHREFAAGSARTGATPSSSASTGR